MTRVGGVVAAVAAMPAGWAALLFLAGSRGFVALWVALGVGLVLTRLAGTVGEVGAFSKAALPWSFAAVAAAWPAVMPVQPPAGSWRWVGVVWVLAWCGVIAATFRPSGDVDSAEGEPVDGSEAGRPGASVVSREPSPLWVPVFVFAPSLAWAAAVASSSFEARAVALFTTAAAAVAVFRWSHRAGAVAAFGAVLVAAYVAPPMVGRGVVPPVVFAVAFLAWWGAFVWASVGREVVELVRGYDTSNAPAEAPEPDPEPEPEPVDDEGLMGRTVVLQRPVGYVQIVPDDGDAEPEHDDLLGRLRVWWPAGRDGEPRPTCSLKDCAEGLGVSRDALREALEDEGVPVPKLNVRPVAGGGSGGTQLAVKWAALQG